MAVSMSTSVYIHYAQARPDEQLDAIILAELQELRRQLPASTPRDIVESLDLAEACAQEKERRNSRQRRHPHG